MSLSSIGKVDIYADTGIDEWEIVKDRIRKEAEAKKVKDGDRQVMAINFTEPLLIEISVRKMPQEKML
jgi:hypothetical protein